MNGCLLAAIIGVVVGFFGIIGISILAAVALPSITHGIAKAKENAAVQQTRAISLALMQYSIDNNAYPDGKTSTEIFQKLVDGKYAQPEIFYFAMPGKTKPTSNTLTPENVCFDVTSGAGTDSSDDVPLVFSTGYTLSYAAGESATPVSGTELPFKGMAVSYKNNSAKFLQADADGAVPNVVPANFDPGTKTYTQLTP